MLLSGSVGVFNALADPYGYVGTAIFPTATLSDRPIKACLARRLPKPPQLVILGSSRAEKVDPSYIEAKIGSTGFNAAVSSATPDDAWAFTHYLHDESHGQTQKVLWLLDVEAMRPLPTNPGLRNTAALSRYLDASTKARADGSTWSLLSWSTTADSWHGVQAALFSDAHTLDARTCSFRTSRQTEYTPNGFRSFDFHDAALQRKKSFNSSLAITLNEYKRIYAADTSLSAHARERFEATIKQLNDWGVRPVIVITPVHPDFATTIGPLGWRQRLKNLNAYLKSLQPRLDFVRLDASDINRFGGRRRDFYDGLHMTLPNVQRMIDWVLRHDETDLKSP